MLNIEKNYSKDTTYILCKLRTFKVTYKIHLKMIIRYLSVRTKYTDLF